jgi:uncharacterized phage protein (TIGR02218 family)
MSKDALFEHLQSGSTTVCRAWTVTRSDGIVLGFTDHDKDLIVEGITCKADTGLTARALQQTTGLSVDNTEAVGALSDVSVTEADLLAGRYDGAKVQAWLVNWANPEERIEQFRGTLGEIVRSNGTFKAELRGLSDALNQPQGFAFQPTCSAVLGDSRCQFDTKRPGYFADRVVESVEDGRIFTLDGLTTFDDRWFEYGRFEVLTGEAVGLIGVIKSDRLRGSRRRVEVWQSIGAPLRQGDQVRLIAGCDKFSRTCRKKFDNFQNFRGFPHIPGEDWLASYPVANRAKTGRSLFIAPPT